MIIREVPLTEVWLLRQQVMYPQFAIDYVQLPKDPDGIHPGLYDGQELLSVISLFVEDGVLQFRKFATRTAFQGQGYGRFLLQYVMDWAMDKKCTLVWCNSRLSAIRLYQKFGMVSAGDTWTKDGIEFIKMQKQLEYYGDHTGY